MNEDRHAGDERWAHETIASSVPVYQLSPGAEGRSLAQMLARARALGPAPARRRRLARFLTAVSGLSAAAAALVIGWLVLGLGPRAATASLADVLRQVQSARNVTFGLVVRTAGQPDARARVWSAGRYMRREWADGRIDIQNVAAEKTLSIDPTNRVARLMESPPDGQMDLLEMLRSAKASPSASKTTEIMGGKLTDVYTVPTADSLTYLWVEPGEEMPLRVEVRFVSPTGRPTVMVMEDVHWNGAVEPGAFRLDVPPGYKLERPDAPPAK